MIARLWHGKTLKSVSDEFQDYIYATGIPGLKSTKGNLGVLLLRRSENEIKHFLLFSFWDSFESILNFAGSDIDKARYYPEEEKWYNDEDKKIAAGFELIDIMHFMMEAFILLGYDWEDIKKLYLVKNIENFHRQDEGYDDNYKEYEDGERL